MPERLLQLCLQYGGYTLELVLLVLLLWRGYLRRLTALCLFVLTLFAIDAGVRPLSLIRYGQGSTEYFDLYWLTELILTFAAFSLIYAFFRNALQHREVWKTIRPALAIVLALELGVSSAAFLQHYHQHQLFTRFVYDFSQDLYFTCVVLNTALYLTLAWFKNRDELLHLLVCGLGIQYAGPAAAAAVAYLTHNGYALKYLSPVCAVLMLCIWIYAVARQPRATAGISSGGGPLAMAA